MSEVWLIEHKYEGEWTPHRSFVPATKEEAEKHAKDSRFDLVPDILRIARYVRDDESVQPMTDYREQAIRDVAAFTNTSARLIEVWMANSMSSLLPANEAAIVYAVAQRMRVRELEARLRCIVKRFDDADEGTLHVRDGVVWAMAADARDALGELSLRSIATDAQLPQKEGERG